MAVLCGLALGGAGFQSRFSSAVRPHNLDKNHAFALGFGEVGKLQLVQYRESEEAEAKVEGFVFASDLLSKQGQEFFLPGDLRVNLTLLENHRARGSQTLRLEFWRNGDYFVSVYEGSSSGFKPVRSSRLDRDSVNGIFWGAFKTGLCVAAGVFLVLVGVMFGAKKRTGFSG